MTDATISMIVRVDVLDDRTKGIFGGDDSAERRDISLERLRAEMKVETDKLLSVIDAIPPRVGWSLSEFEIGVEISGEGGINFIGVATAGVRAAVKLRFIRQ